MKILVSSWEAVSAQTIVKCFRKAGITPKAQNAAITDADDLFPDLKESLKQLHDIYRRCSRRCYCKISN